MATINHHHHPHNHHPHNHHSITHRRPKLRHSLDYSSLPSSSSSIKHPSTTTTTTISLPSHITFSLPSTTTSATNPATSYSLDTLERHLAAQNFRQADEETRRLIIVLAGDPAIKRGYVFFSEVQFIPKEDLLAIDELWKKFTNGRFGYSVQRRIWLKVNKDFTSFFLKVGWMKKLDTEVEQYNYRSFPNEFMWELKSNANDQDDSNSNSNSNSNSSNNNNDDVPPEGHLPLTNALRGTQLLNCLLTHPAFAGDGEDKDGGNDNEQSDGQVVVDEVDKKKSRFASLRDKLFKPNYSF